MRMSFSGNSVCGTVTAPSSKSHTHRALFISSLADGESTILDPLISDDTLSTIQMLRAMGSDIVFDGNDVHVRGGLEHPSEPLNAGNSGTAMRFGIALASLFDHRTEVYGDASLMKRPMLPLLRSLEEMGAEFSIGDMISIKGPVKGGSVDVPGDISSQFASAILLIAPKLNGGVRLNVHGNASKPYLDMTVDAMRMFGSEVTVTGGTFETEGSGYTSAKYPVPGDASSAAYILAAGALAGKVKVKNLTQRSGGDMRILDILSSIGAYVSSLDDEVAVENGHLRPVNIDISRTPDLFPIVSVLLSVAGGKSVISNISGLRYKESDRVAATMEMMNGLGGRTEVNGDEFIIRGVRSLKGGNVHSRNDHRMMMAAAVASLVSDAPVVVDDCECHNISYPGFIEDMRSIGIHTEVV